MAVDLRIRSFSGDKDGREENDLDENLQHFTNFTHCPFPVFYLCACESSRVSPKQKQNSNTLIVFKQRANMNEIN